MSMAYIAGFVAVSALVHLALLTLLSRRVFMSVLVLVGSAFSVVAYQLWVYVQLGSVDPFFRIAAVIQFGLSLLVGTIVAVVLRVRRRGELTSESGLR